MSQLTLGLLPHLGESISSMQDSGQASRFLSYYLERYIEHFKQVYYFSYANEHPILPNGCTLLPKRYNLRNIIYTFVMPFAWGDYFQHCQVLRVFQTLGVLPAALAKARFGIPFAVTYGYHYDEFARLQRSRSGIWYARVARQVAFRMADAIIVTTEELYQYVCRQVPSARVLIIPNGVDTTVFCPTSSEDKPSKTLTVIFVGDLVSRKNQVILVKAVSLIPTRLRLLLVGDGPERDALARLAVILGVDLVMSGALPYHEVASALQQADIFVLPSLIEGSPKSLIEAMSCGLPVIATRITGVSSLVEDGVTGLLCELTPQGFADAIQKLLDNPALMNALGHAAREKICQGHDIGRPVLTEIELLKNLAGNNSRKLI